MDLCGTRLTNETSQITHQLHSRAKNLRTSVNQTDSESPTNDFFLRNKECG